MEECYFFHFEQYVSFFMQTVYLQPRSNTKTFALKTYASNTINTIRIFPVVNILSAIINYTAYILYFLLVKLHFLYGEQ